MTDSQIAVTRLRSPLSSQDPFIIIFLNSLCNTVAGHLEDQTKMTSREVSTYRFLGITVHPLTEDDLLRAIESIIDSNADNCIIGHQNLHGLYLLHNNESMRRFYNENLYTYIDGMSLIILARFFGIPLRRHHRAAALDWFEDFLRIAEKRNWRIYFLGGKPEVASGVPEHFRTIYPNLRICSHHGYDAFSSDTSVYKEIEEFAPHVLLVGMGMPLQEQWILESQDKLRVSLITTIGATMDYFMGAQKPAPRWIGQIGLEWFFRLICRPKSLFGRYLLEPLALLPIILRELMTRNAYFEE